MTELTITTDCPITIYTRGAYERSPKARRLRQTQGSTPRFTRLHLGALPRHMLLDSPASVGPKRTVESQHRPNWRHSSRIYPGCLLKRASANNACATMLAAGFSAKALTHSFIISDEDRWWSALGSNQLRLLSSKSAALKGTAFESTVLKNI